MSDRENCSTPFAAGLLGGLIGTVFTLSAVYLSNEKNRKILASRFEGMKKSIAEEAGGSKKKLAQNLRGYADQLETEKV